MARIRRELFIWLRYGFSFPTASLILPVVARKRNRGYAKAQRQPKKLSAKSMDRNTRHCLGLFKIPRTNMHRGSMKRIRRLLMPSGNYPKNSGRYQRPEEHWTLTTALILWLTYAAFSLVHRRALVILEQKHYEIQVSKAVSEEKHCSTHIAEKICATLARVEGSAGMGMVDQSGTGAIQPYLSADHIWY